MVACPGTHLDLSTRWVTSGAASLTGDEDGPGLVAPAGVVERVEALGAAVGPGVDALGLIGVRAALAGLGRRGDLSCGGATRLLPATDGWVAVSLARPEDVELVPAWFEGGPAGDDPWATVATEVAARAADEVVARGRLLGLPVAVLGEAARRARAGARAGRQAADEPVPAPRPGVVAARLAGGPGPAREPLVVDLSSLWAGPLCARLLGDTGARVVKVESTGRPDGARRGAAPFYDLLHAGHRSVALDFTDPAGREALRRLVAAADVVIEASRPRALAGLGLPAAELVRSGVRAWVSITGHGRDLDAVAFGDDAAVAGGLVAVAGDGRPRFVADAVADPLTGLAAAGAALRALRDGGRWLLDVSMAHVAAEVASGAPPGTLWPEAAAGEAVRPRARAPHARAAPLGADTAAVLAELADPPPARQPTTGEPAAGEPESGEPTAGGPGPGTPGPGERAAGGSRER